MRYEMKVGEYEWVEIEEVNGIVVDERDVARYAATSLGLSVREVDPMGFVTWEVHPMSEGKLFTWESPWDVDTLSEEQDEPTVPYTTPEELIERSRPELAKVLRDYAWEFASLANVNDAEAA